VVRRTSSPSTVVQDHSRIRDVVHVKDRLQVAICEPVEVDDDGGIFGQQRINNTERIICEMNIASLSIHTSLACIAYGSTLA